MSVLIKIKSSIQEADIQKRLRKFHSDLIHLNLIKKGEDAVKELDGESGAYLITLELKKTSKEVLPLLESLGVPAEGAKYFDVIELYNIFTKNGKYVISQDESKEGYQVCLSEPGTKADVLAYFRENNTPQTNIKNETTEVFSEETEVEVKDNDKVVIYILPTGELKCDNADKCKPEDLEKQGCKDIKLFNASAGITLKYITPDGNVGTTQSEAKDAQKVMTDLASSGCTKVQVTNDDHYTKYNGPRSVKEEEHEFEEMFSKLRDKLQTAPKDIKNHFNNILKYFSNSDNFYNTNK